MIDPDEQLRVAVTAIAERDHLARVYQSLTEDVAAEERRVHQLAIELQHERADVERMTTGVLGFLNDLITPAAVFDEERRQVVEAQARLAEAQGSVDELRRQLVNVESKLRRLRLRDLESELAAARAVKEQALLRSGTAAAAELQDLAIRIESIDIELVPLTDAVEAGSAAVDAITQIVRMLDGLSAKQAKAVAGEAQAKVVGFARALADVVTADLGGPITIDAADTAFADAWVKLLASKRAAHERLAAARADMLERSARIGAILAPLRMRHDELAARRSALVTEKQRLLA